MRQAARAALLALGLGACASDRPEAERAVRAYAAALVASYRANDAAALAPVATARELRKVTALVDLKRAGGLVLESELEALEILSVTRPAGDRMDVRARERWRYHDRHLQQGAAQGPTFVAVIELEYHFVREGGAWKMDEARASRTEYLEPKGYAPHQVGHGAREGGAASPSR